MRTRTRIVVLGACAAVGIGAAGCGDDDKDTSSSGGGTKLSSDSKKVFKASATTGGLEAKSKTFDFKPGDTVDGPGLEQFITQNVKQRTGLDVKVACPPSTTFTVGGVFYCKLTLPDGTAYDVKCTMLQDGNVQVEIITTQPTPPVPPGPQTNKLKGAADTAKTTRLGQSEASKLDTTPLDENIEQFIKQNNGIDVNAECPDEVDNIVGSVFYCKLYLQSGTVYDVECTVKENNIIAWRVVT